MNLYGRLWDGRPTLFFVFFSQTVIWFQVLILDFDIPPWQILKDPELAMTWIIDWLKTTVETSKRRLRRLNEEIAKYGKKWSLSETSAAPASGKVPSPVSRGGGRGILNERMDTNGGFTEPPILITSPPPEFHVGGPLLPP